MDISFEAHKDSLFRLLCVVRNHAEVFVLLPIVWILIYIQVGRRVPLRSDLAFSWILKCRTNLIVKLYFMGHFQVNDFSVDFKSRVFATFPSPLFLKTMDNEYESATEFEEENSFCWSVIGQQWFIDFSLLSILYFVLHRYSN